MLESLYQSSAGNRYSSFSQEFIDLSISLKDIVSIELFDNIENYKRCFQTNYLKAEIVIYILPIENHPKELFPGSLFLLKKYKICQQSERLSDILARYGLSEIKQSISDQQYTMMKKNVILEVKVGSLKMKFQNQQPVILSLFLSFAKKSMQIKKQNPPKTQASQSLEIDHLFRIQYEEIDLSKHKYCLLFVYQIKQFGRKKTLGNAPLSIVQFNGKGIQTVKLQQCEDTQASIQITINVHNDQDPVLAEKSIKNSKPSILKQFSQNNTQYANSPQNLSNITDKSGKISKVQMNNNSTRTFLFQESKEMVNSWSGDIVLTSPELQPSKEQLSNNKKTAQFFRHQEVSFSDSNKFLNLPFILEKQKNSSKDLANNLNSSLEIIHHEDKDQPKLNCSQENTSLQLISKPEQIITKKNSPIMFNSFSKAQSHEFFQNGKKPNRKIQSFEVAQFIPTKNNERTPMKIYRVIAISFKGKSSTSFQPSPSNHSVPSKKVSTRTQYNYVQSDFQIDHDTQPIENLKESKQYISNIMILRNKYFDAVKINQEIVEENKKLTQNLRLQQTQMNKSNQIFVRAISQLREKVTSAHSLREEYEEVIYEKQHRMRQLQWKNESLSQQNRQLKSHVNQLQIHTSHLRQVLSSYGEAKKIEKIIQDNKANFRKQANLSAQERKKGITSPNLRINIDQLINNSSADDEALRTNKSKTDSQIRVGRIVSNKNSINSPVCSSPHQSKASSNYSQNGIVVNKKFNNYSDIGQNSRLKSNLYDTPVGSQKKGIIIDYMQAKNNAKLTSSQVRNISEKNGGKAQKQKQTQKKQYFFNKKYLHKQKGQNQKQS